MAGRKRPDLTERQRQFVAAVERLAGLQGYAPSYRELSRELGVNVPRVQQLVTVVERKGFVVHARGIPRSLRVVRKEGADVSASE